MGRGLIDTETAVLHKLGVDRRAELKRIEQHFASTATETILIDGSFPILFYNRGPDRPVNSLAIHYDPIWKCPVLTGGFIAFEMDVASGGSNKNEAEWIDGSELIGFDPEHVRWDFIDSLESYHLPGILCNEFVPGGLEEPLVKRVVNGLTLGKQRD